MTLRRDKETATLTGTLSARGLVIAQLGFSGRLGGTLEFASTGQSAAALIEGLAGGGKAQFAGTALARSDPAALDRVVAKAQAPDALLDETNLAYAFGAELAKAPLPIPDGATPVALTSGTAKFGPLAIALPHRGGYGHRQFRLAPTDAGNKTCPRLRRGRPQILVRAAADRDIDC